MNKIKVILIFSLSLFIISCGIFKHGHQTVLTDEIKLDNTSDFIDGCKEKILGDYDNAIVTFKSCIKTDPSNPAPLYELAGIYYQQKNYKDGLPLIEKATKLEPGNQWFQLLYANLLITQLRYKDAIDVYQNLAKAHPENIEYFFDWAAGYIYLNKYSDAIDVYNMIEEKTGVNEDISLQKERIYLAQNKPDKAIEEIQKLINAFPTETDYYNILADLYLKSKMEDKALEIYQKILSIDPNNGNVHLSLADYYREKGEKDKSYEELKLAFASQGVDIDTKVKILLSYYTVTEKSDQLKEQAYELIDILLKTHPTEAKAYSIYGDFLYRDNKLKEAKEQFEKVMSLDSSKFEIWEQILIIESEQYDYKAIESDCKHALELFPEQPRLYLFYGEAEYFLKKYDEALTSLNKGLIMVVDNNDLLKQFYTYLGDVEAAKNNYTDAFTNYDKALVIDPLDYYVLNNYSYYISVHGGDLDKAADMAEKAAEANPDNASFLDTYGWVLYKQAKYSDAEKWLSKALENKGDASAVIMEHYGDILYKLNQPDRAMEYWIKAKQKGTGSPLLDKKINDKKLYE